MRRLFVFIAIWSAFAEAHEAQIITQHLKLNQQHASAWQTDVLARANVNEKFDLGLQGTYLERFSFFEKRAGGFVTYRPSDKFIFEAKYLKGEEDVVILPHDQYTLSVYHALTEGLSPYLTYRSSLYSITHVQTFNLGLEIEKIRSVILVPQVVVGQAKFTTPSEVKSVYNIGLRAIYYKEKKYSASVFGYKGTEAAQALVGESNRVIHVMSGGFSASYYFIQDLKTEFIFDYLDLGKLDNQFITSTLNLIWTF